MGAWTYYAFRDLFPKVLPRLELAALTPRRRLSDRGALVWSRWFESHSDAALFSIPSYRVSEADINSCTRTAGHFPTRRIAPRTVQHCLTLYLTLMSLSHQWIRNRSLPSGHQNYRQCQPTSRWTASPTELSSTSRKASGYVSLWTSWQPESKWYKIAPIWISHRSGNEWQFLLGVQLCLENKMALATKPQTMHSTELHHSSRRYVRLCWEQNRGLSLEMSLKLIRAL